MATRRQIKTFNFGVDHKESVCMLEKTKKKKPNTIESIKTKSHTMNTRHKRNGKSKWLVKAMNWHKFMKLGMSQTVYIDAPIFA